MDTSEKKENEIRRFRLKNIIDTYFEGDNDVVVRAIKDATGHEVSVRSIQAWLIDPRRVSHRIAPEWALRGLEDYVKRPEKKDELARHAERVQERRKAPRQELDWSDEVRNSRAVEFATSQIESENRQIARWQELFGTASGKAIAEAFHAQRKEIESMSKALGAITRAMKQCDTFETFKSQANLAMQDQDFTNLYVREARKAVEQCSEEFSNPEGLPKYNDNKNAV